MVRVWFSTHVGVTSALWDHPVRLSALGLSRLEVSRL